MKNLLFLFLMIASIATAQKNDKPDCIISGPATVVAGVPTDFFISQLAQCTFCYDWDVSSLGNTVSIQGDDRKSVVTILANGSGIFNLKVTYFTETGCHTCQRNIVIDSSPQCDFEPEFITKFDCSPQGEGRVFLGNIDLSEVSSVTYYFEPNNNQGYYDNFAFVGGGNGIVVTDAPFIADCTYTPGTCRPDDIITLSVTIEFESSSICETIEEVYDIEVIDHGGQKPLIDVYPNPTESLVSVELKHLKDKAIELQLLNLSGQLMSTEKLTMVPEENYTHALILPKTSEQALWLRIVENGVVIETKKILLK